MNTELRKDCPMRHECGNCQPAGGFCTAVNDPICEALHNAYNEGWHGAALWARQEAAKNEPLTLDELRLMDGEPAYFVSLRDGFSAWGIVHVVNMSQSWFIAISGTERAFGDRDSYGTAWIGYRHKPKEATP